MKINKICSLTDTLHDMLSQIKASSGTRNSTDYYEIASDDEGNALSVSITEEKDGDAKWYSIHTIDDITQTDCDLHFTETMEETELLSELVLILQGTIGELLGHK